MHQNRFIEIFKYQYLKYLDIFLSIYHWIFTYCQIKFNKLFNPHRKHVAILLAEHFGDIVACEPLSRELRKMYPNAKVYWIVKKAYRELLDFNPNIDVVIEEYSVLHSILLTKKNPFDHFYNCHLSGLRRYSPKDWQVYFWEKLVLDLLISFDYGVIEIGLESNLKVCHSGYYNFCGKLTLLETAEIIRKADFFIGIDSGPAHFANAVNTFGFLLFGKLGDFKNYMPYSGEYEAKSNVKFIVKNGQPCSDLEYDEVWKVVFENINRKKLVNIS